MSAIPLIERLSHAKTHADLSLFGEAGRSLMRPSDLLVIEWAFHEDQSLKHFVEVGSLTGLSSLYFAQFCRMRGGEFHAFDKRQPLQKYRELWPALAMFHQCDVLVEANDEVVQTIEQPHSFVLLDNGNKPRELELYAKHLPERSVLAVHNFGSEVDRQCNWQAIVDAAGLTEYLTDECKEWHSSLRCWRRII